MMSARGLGRPVRGTARAAAAALCVWSRRLGNVVCKLPAHRPPVAPIGRAGTAMVFAGGVVGPTQIIRVGFARSSGRRDELRGARRTLIVGPAVVWSGSSRASSARAPPRTRSAARSASEALSSPAGETSSPPRRRRRRRERRGRVVGRVGAERAPRGSFARPPTAARLESRRRHTHLKPSSGEAHTRRLCLSVALRLCALARSLFARPTPRPSPPRGHPHRAARLRCLGFAGCAQTGGYSTSQIRASGSGIRTHRSRR